MSEINTIDISLGGTEYVQAAVMPTASVTELGNIYQYIGVTDANFTHGYYYECVQNGAIYSWERQNVQPAGAAAFSDITGDSEDNAKIAADKNVTAQALAELKEAVESVNMDELGMVHCKSVNMDELPSVCGYPAVVIEALSAGAAPAVTPDFVGQIFIDTGNSIAYIATGVASASNWKRITN